MWKSSGNHVDMDVSHSDSYLLYLDYKQRVFHIFADIFARGCVERVDLNNKKCMIWNDFAGNWILRPLKLLVWSEKLDIEPEIIAASYIGFLPPKCLCIGRKAQFTRNHAF